MHKHLMHVIILHEYDVLDMLLRVVTLKEEPMRMNRGIDNGIGIANFLSIPILTYKDLFHIRITVVIAHNKFS